MKCVKVKCRIINLFANGVLTAALIIGILMSFVTDRQTIFKTNNRKERDIFTQLRYCAPSKATFKGKFIPYNKELDYTEAKENDRRIVTSSTKDLNYNLEKQLPYIPRIKSTINCKALFENNTGELNKTLEHKRQSDKSSLSPNYYINATKNCQIFLSNRTYIQSSLSVTEVNFPIAFSILMYTDVHLSERLLRAIYRPQNYYCIHVDNKSGENIKEAMRSIASCFNNVFISSKSVSVFWGHISILEAELACMRDLMGFNWRYYINLTGQEFPLKTNLELVEILQALNGSNSVQGSVKKMIGRRTKFVYKNRNKTSQLKFPPPINVTLVKGEVHMVAVRGFVDYILNNKSAQQFFNWLKDTDIPDETFYSTLNYNYHLGAPGAYRGKTDSEVIDEIHTNPKNPFLARLKNWKNDTFPCHGRNRRHLCIYGIGDLPYLINRKQLFANKFISSVQPEAYECMEEWHFNKTHVQLEEGYKINISFYKGLDIVIDHL